MPVALSLVKVTKRFGAQPILENLSFGLMTGEKVGLIGRNGAGKSTLFKLLAGEDTPDSGEVVLTQGLRVARLSQDPHFPPGATVRSALEWALSDHRELIRRHAEIHEALTGAAPDAAERLHQELDAVEHHLGHMGWDLEPRLKEAVTTWGLLDLEAEVEALSGGWRKRVALAQAWLKDPDVLVLDEPTNHLDPEQVERLEGWLQAFAGALLLITHDRHLLDGVVDRMLELENGAVTSYEGSYSDYLLEKSDREFREARLTEHMQNRLRRELAWLRRGAKARTRKSKLRIQDVLDLKDDVKDRTRQEQRVSLAFAGGSNRSDSLLQAEGLRFAYPGTDRDLAGGLDLVLQRGMRIALLGPNGCGKSTVLKLLLGELEPTAGALTRHPRLSVSAISQGRGELRGDLSVADNIAERASMVKVGGSEMLVLVYLSRFGFPADQQKRAAGTLSGGERNRLLLAKAMLQPADLLVLDEPTNDLDIPTLQNLEEALLDYPGALLLVSHDRFFLDQVATHTLAWNPAGTPRWEFYEGNPASVRRLRAERAQEAPRAAAAKAAAPRTDTRDPSRRKPGLSQKEARRLAEVEAAMAGLQARIAGLEALMADPAAFISADAPGHQALRDKEAALADLDVLEMEWLELEEKREA
ncbi:ABC-F family ATP-binding cassette domain-containing protein [Mesoterricola sediminis]|uniref:ABC transporter ATP-binding protein n=1 Tax=Mesoterricola sediminis TaxID=2927980 RepID=A0AA48GW10_9BACT|nr:ABC-F family ATP-binding cassette domain-containing protein [Mesoterricola sediminis]BDU77309.1 ABC transporter ATP-binding protein [Mesoterricola sediminis]